MTTTRIEVFADVLCPFTHIGLLRLVEARAAAGRDDVRLWIRAWPLEVVNGTPLDAGFIAEEIEEIRDQVGPSVFTGFRPEAFPASSLPLLALVHAAYARDLALGEAVSLEVRRKLFEEGVAVGAPDQVAALAGAHGIEVGDADVAGVLADHEEGARRGVVGSPYFITPAGSFFCPALDVARDADGHLRVHADPEGFDRFLQACFA
jgi:predicted DsbA family dithiol-disulfide isomerase